MHFVFSVIIFMFWIWGPSLIVRPLLILCLGLFKVKKHFFSLLVYLNTFYFLCKLQFWLLIFLEPQLVLFGVGVRFKTLFWGLLIWLNILYFLCFDEFWLIMLTWFWSHIGFLGPTFVFWKSLNSDSMIQFRVCGGWVGVLTDNFIHQS